MLKKLFMLIVAGFFLASCAATKTEQGGDVDAASASSSSGGEITAGTQEDLIVNVGDRVFFGYDSSDLDSDALELLQDQVAWLKQNSNVSVTIEGHCDERGTREYNLALGERRANAARDYLMTYGISGKRISTISYGKTVKIWN